MVINVMINVKPKLTLDLRNAKNLTVHPMKALVIKKLAIDHSLLIGNKQKLNL
jgi:succinate dehydrogenase/fumarate reductase-like Fe-S protein